MASWYAEHPPRKTKLGSEWQGYARLLASLWVTAAVALAALIGVKAAGILPGSEAFAADYDLSLPAVPGQIAIDWTLQPFVALSIQGPACTEGWQQVAFSEAVQFGICGLPGGRPYISVARPVKDITGYNCPPGAAPCSAHTSVANTVCYPTEEHATACPITGLRFASAGSERDWTGY